MKIVNEICKYEKSILYRILNTRIGIIGNSFTRNRNLNFKNIVSLILGRKGKSTTMELFEFYKKAEKRAVSKQDFSKQRLKISEDFFINAIDLTVDEFYSNYKYKTFDGYILVAIDGSKTILPRVKELEDIYGLANANNSQQKCVQCNMSGCYDCLNNIMLDVQIGKYASDERQLAKENLKALKRKLPDKKFLIIFDRGYPSMDMLYFLETNGFKYLIRLQDSTYEKEKQGMKRNDEKIKLEVTPDRLAGKMDKETKEKLKENGYIETRFIKYELSTGNIEWLATNLEKYNSNKIGELYFKRWKIEICFNTLKNKLQIENISGKKNLTVLQDIYSTIVIYNMIATIEFLLEKEEINKEENKYDYKINENILIGAFKDIFIEIVITNSEKRKKQLNELLYQCAIRNKTAIINNRSYPREFKNGSTKCKVNLKRSF